MVARNNMAAMIQRSFGILTIGSSLSVDHCARTATPHGGSGILRGVEHVMRFLTVDDIPAACALSDAAGWNQTPEDWRRIIELEPFGSFGVVVDESLVATTTVLTYGSDMAWIGMVLTHAEYRRRGYARQ